jgi:hypothetical protein
MNNQIRICSNHPHRKTPLIWTFAFSGAEYWCPYCGYKSGMFGAGESVDATPELEATLKNDKEQSQHFLHAVSAQTCDLLEYKGKRITPHDLPDEEKEKNRAVIEAWKYPAIGEKK